MSNNEADRLAERYHAGKRGRALDVRDDYIQELESALAALVKQQAPEATAEPAAVPVVHPNVINALKKERDGWHEEATNLAKQLRIAQVDLDMRREHQAKDVWYWQGDGEDHVESMGNRMLVAIYASDLRAALAAQGAQKAEAWKSAHDDARDAILNGRGPLEAVLDGDQTNAVLDAFDDAFSPLYATPQKAEATQAEPMSDETIERMVLNRPDMAQAIHFDIIPMGAFVDLGRAILAEAGIKEKP